MHVAFFYFFLRDGGVEKNLTHLANRFAHSGRYQTSFVLMDLKGHFVSHMAPNITLADFKLQPFRLIDHAKCVLMLACYMRRQRPDVMITGLPAANITVILAKLLSCTRTKVIVSDHGPTLMWLKNRKNHPLLKWLLKMLIGVLYRFANQVVVVSDFLISDLSQLTHIAPQRIKRIYNPIVNAEMVVMSQEAVNHPWLSRKTNPVILAIGRLASEKNFALLLRSFSIVSRDHPDARLIILGEGAQRNELETLASQLGIADVVSMPGFCANPYAFMSKANMLVLSSNYEGLPTVLVEALACGCPVVSTNCPGGTAEILGKGRYGALVSVGNMEALKAAITDVLDHPDVARQRTLDFQAHKMQEFSVENVEKQYMALVDVY